MATSHIPMGSGPGSTISGRALADDLATLGAAFARVKAHFRAMSEQLDGDGTLASHFDANKAVFGFVDAVGSSTLSNDTAKASYDELNVLISFHADAIEQTVARHAQ